MLSVIVSFGVDFPSPLVTIAFLADIPSQSDSLVAFQCFTSGIFGPLENRLVHLSIPIVFVVCAIAFYGFRCVHIHCVVRRRHALLWDQVAEMSRAHDEKVEFAMRKLTFRARLFHALEDQSEMIERMLEETGFKFNELEKLDLQESCNELNTDVAMCYECYSMENIVPATDNQQGFALCEPCASRAYDYAQFLCGFPTVKDDDVDDLIGTVRDSVVQEGVLSPDVDAAKKREEWRANRVVQLEKKIHATMSDEDYTRLFSIEAFIHALRTKLYGVALARVKSAFIVTLVVGLFFLHPMATKHTFKLLACVDINEGVGDSDWRMLTDLEQQCDFSDPTYMMWLLIGVTLLVVYVISLPLVVLIVLAARRHRLYERRVKFRFGFLYSGFTKRFFWWEIWTMYRKALTIMLAVFLQNYGSNSNLQVLVGTVIVMAALAVQFFCRPFARSEIDTLEEIGLIAVYFAFFAGLFYLNIDEVKSDEILQQLLMWLTILFTTTFIIYWLYIAFPEVMFLFRRGRKPAHVEIVGRDPETRKMQTTGGSKAWIRVDDDIRGCCGMRRPRSKLRQTQVVDSSHKVTWKKGMSVKIRLDPLRTPEGYDDDITKRRWFAGTVTGVFESGPLQGAVKVTLPRNWIDAIYSCLECCKGCIPFLNNIGMIHKRRKTKRQELFRQYDLHREQIPLRQQLIGELYKGPLMAKSLGSKKRTHFNLKFVSQLVRRTTSGLKRRVSRLNGLSLLARTVVRQRHLMDQHSPTKTDEGASTLKKHDTSLFVADENALGSLDSDDRAVVISSNGDLDLGIGSQGSASSRPARYSNADRAPGKRNDSPDGTKGIARNKIQPVGRGPSRRRLHKVPPPPAGDPSIEKAKAKLRNIVGEAGSPVSLDAALTPSSDGTHSQASANHIRNLSDQSIESISLQASEEVAASAPRNAPTRLSPHSNEHKLASSSSRRRDSPTASSNRQPMEITDPVLARKFSSTVFSV